MLVRHALVLTLMQQPTVVTRRLVPSLYRIPTSYTMLPRKALVAASPAHCRHVYRGVCLSSDVYYCECSSAARSADSARCRALQESESGGY